MNNVWLAFGLTVFAGLATGIGSAIAFFAKRTNYRFLSSATGFSAGVMIGICCITTIPLSSLAAETLPFLSVSGANIVTSSGTQVFLRGVNFGNWLLWEGGSLGIVNHPEHRLRQMLEKKVDPTKVDIFFKTIVEHYIRADDFGRVRDAGLNVVRLPFHHRYVHADRLTELDDAVRWAAENGVYVILDLHAAPGGQSGDYHADADGVARLWLEPQLQEETLRLWETLTTRYRDEPAVAGYEILNEPDAADSAALAAFYCRAIDRVRAIDSRHIIFLDGNHFASDFDVFMPLPEQNLVYVFHYYCETADEMRARVNEKGYHRFSRQYQVPVMCFEFGDYRLTRDFERSGIHWAPWNYKTIAEYSCGSLYHAADTSPWNRWLADINDRVRTTERESGSIWTDLLAGSALSPACRKEITRVFDRDGITGEELKRAFRQARNRYPDDQQELERLSRLSLSRREELWIDTMAARLNSMEIEEIRTLAESLNTKHWIQDRATVRFLETKFR